MKYGIRDHRGGGRSSGRETSCRVFAGALAKLLLREYGITVGAGVVRIGKTEATDYEWNPPFPAPLYAPRCREYEEMEAEIRSAMNDMDSVGGVIECRVGHMIPGLGEPVAGKLDADLAGAIMSIGAVKGIEIGSGFSGSSSRGSENNDRMRMKDGRVVPAFVSQALRGEPITIYGQGTQTRSFCYCSDLIEGIYRLMMSEEIYPVNIGNPTELTILDFAREIIALTGAKSQLIHMELPIDDPKQRRPDISRAKHLLNWEPQISLREGLEKTIQWFAEEIQKN